VTAYCACAFGTRSNEAMIVKRRILIFILFGFLNGDVFGGGDGNDAIVGDAAGGDGQIGDARLRCGMQVLLLVLDDPIFLFHRVAASEEITGLVVAGTLGTRGIGSGRAGGKYQRHKGD
jgi:hypothetical protein